jgi:hypothetical protein
MGCPREYKIGSGENLIFSICTHNPATGFSVPADSYPIFRVYEEETETPVLTGTMDTLDDSNTVGFYTGSIPTTNASDFKSGKNYTIYISAIVNTFKGGIAYTFKANPWIRGKLFTSITAKKPKLSVTPKKSKITVLGRKPKIVPEVRYQ